MRLAFIAVVGVAVLGGCGKSKSIGEEFPGKWQAPTIDVIRTLAQNEVRGCGEFYQKRAAEYEGEYVVACTRDGRNWAVWRVWTGSNQVIGPDLTILGQLGGPPVTHSN